MSSWVNSGCAVGAEVLVTEAARDLVVALEAADHQQLLEQLRRLRQRVPVPGCSRTGTRKSRAPSGVDRVRYGVSMSRKSCASITRRISETILAAGADRAGRAGTPQVEVAVLPAAASRRRRSRSRRRRRSGTAAGRSRSARRARRRPPRSRRSRGRVDVAVGRGPHRAGDGDAPLAAQLVRPRRGRGRRPARAAGVAEVEERHPAVVAAARDPAGQGDVGADVGRRAASPASWVRITASSSLICVDDLRPAIASRAATRTGRRRRPARRCGCRAPGRRRPACGNQTNGMPRRSA